jgi:aminoglycoside phosphotransferase
MTPQNLAIVFSPNLIRGSSAMTDFGSLGVANSFVKLSVARWKDVFLPNLA